jgi:hypothetical protein
MPQSPRRQAPSSQTASVFRKAPQKFAPQSGKTAETSRCYDLPAFTNQEEYPMRNAILCLSAALSLMAAAPGMASAGTLMPSGQTVTSTAPTDGNANLVLVAGGCGIGFHRGPAGHCRPNWVRPRPVHHWRRCESRWTHHGWVRVCRYY